MHGLARITASQLEYIHGVDGTTLNFNVQVVRVQTRIQVLLPKISRLSWETSNGASLGRTTVKFRKLLGLIFPVTVHKLNVHW